MTLLIERAVCTLRDEGYPIGLTVTQNQAPGYAKDCAEYSIPWERDHLGRYGPAFTTLTDDMKCSHLVSVHYDTCLPSITAKQMTNVVIGPGEAGPFVYSSKLWQSLAHEIAFDVGRKLHGPKAIGDIDWSLLDSHDCAGRFRLHNADYIERDDVNWDLCSGINIGPEFAHTQMRQLLSRDRVSKTIKNEILRDHDKRSRWNVLGDDADAMVCCGHYHIARDAEYNDDLPLLNYMRRRLDDLLS